MWIHFIQACVAHDRFEIFHSRGRYTYGFSLLVWNPAERLARSKSYLERALELEPEDPTLQEHLGDAYWMVGREREAKFQWQHALDRDPAEDIAKKVKTKLTEGMKAPARVAGQG